ncbi:hypothetical protein RQP46_007875 [Phenoliferia psychrophenolica]
MATLDEKENGSINHIDNATRDPSDLAKAESAEFSGVEPEVHFKTWIIVFASSLAFCAYVWSLVAFGLNQRSVAAAVGDPNNFIWIQNAAQLVSLVVAPPLGKISDAAGRKQIFGLVCGAVGLVLTGAATSIGMAIGGSAIFGFSSASAYILSATVSEILPRRQRGMAQAIFNVFGFAFYAPAMVMFISACMLAACYNPPPTPNPDQLTLTHRFLDFDVVGTLLLIAGITPLTIGLTWGGTTYAWKAAASWAPVLIGCVFLVGLMVHQVFFKKDGLLHHDMFRGRNMALACGIVFAEGMFYFTYNAFFGEETQVLFETDPVIFGVRFGVFAMTNLIGYPIVGWYTTKYRRVKEPLVVGFVVFTAIMAAQSQATQSDSWNKAFIAFSALAGFVFTAPELLVFVIAQLDVPPHLVGTASTLLGSIRALGGVIGTSVSTSIFSVKFTSAIPVYLPPALVAAGLPEASIPAFIKAVIAGSPAGFAKIPGISPTIIASGVTAYKAAFAHSFSFVWYFVLPFVILALCASIALAPVKHQMTAMIDRPVEVPKH